MSRYAVNSLLYRLKKDREFRARFSTDPRAALADADLTEAERAAFLARDMRSTSSAATCTSFSRSRASPCTDRGLLLRLEPGCVQRRGDRGVDGGADDT